MKIETYEQANEAIQALQAWLLIDNQKPDDIYEEAPKTDWVRGACHTLLSVTNAVTLSGCPLCQS
jgi:hypothetical protein